MLPMTVLRRFDCVLAPSKAKVLAEHERSKERFKGEALDARLNKAAGQRFHNHSPLDFERLKGDPDNIAQHLVSYINGFSTNVRRIFEYFEFGNEIEKMREANILYLVVSKFCDVDLHPDRVFNPEMGLMRCQLGAPEPTYMDTSFFLSRESLIPSERPDLQPWREQIFMQMANTALDATRYFRLPPDRVVEIGSQVEI